jgi:hypothetical protein
MRTIFAMLVISLAIAARAQNAPSARTVQSARTLTPPAPPNRNLPYIRPEKPNEIRKDRVTYSGSFVYLAKRENPLQLINPLAPLPYTSMDNVVLDPISIPQRAMVQDPIVLGATGWKLFSISF